MAHDAKSEAEPARVESDRTLLERFERHASWEVQEALAARALDPELCARVLRTMRNRQVKLWPALLSTAFRGAPDAAFEMAARFLGSSAPADSFHVEQAFHILHVLHEHLIARSMEDPDSEPPPMPDLRWRGACERFLSGHPEMREANVARNILDAFAWSGGSVTPAVQSIDLAGPGIDDAPFPLFIVGFSTLPANAETRAAVEDVAQGAPPGLAWFFHQYQGFRDAEATFLGYPVRLPLAFEHTHLRRLMETWFDRSNEMPESDRAAWSSVLREVVDMPPLEFGAEALILTGPCSSPGKVLGGEPLLRFRACAAPWLPLGSLLFWPGPEITLGEPFGDAHERVLLRLGEVLACGAPRIALLGVHSS